MTMRIWRPASADVCSLHLLPENASCSLDCHGLFYKDTTLSDTVHDAQDRHDDGQRHLDKSHSRRGVMTNKPRGTVTVTVGHIDYVAEYAVEHETLTVMAAHGSKSVPLNGNAPEEKARILLGEMIKEGTASDCV